MRWTQNTAAMLIFSGATLLLTYFVERLQAWLPLNPQHLANGGPALALNTAISFTTNTNWQSDTPESTTSYLTQMLRLATHNFWFAAVGLALAIAFVRGIARREAKTLGNFWVDLTRGTLWVLLPISLVFAIALVSQGVVPNGSAVWRRPREELKNENERMRSVASMTSVSRALLCTRLVLLPH